jgi:hypothetical protein
MKAVDVQIITYAPTIFYHCQHCEVTFGELGVGDRVHREQAGGALPSDLHREFEVLSDQLHGLTERWGSRVRVRVIDAASLEGFWKSLRYRAWRYPTAIINGRSSALGDTSVLNRLVEQSIEHPAAETVNPGRTGGH